MLILRLVAAVPLTAAVPLAAFVSHAVHSLTLIAPNHRPPPSPITGLSAYRSVRLQVCLPAGHQRMSLGNHT